MVHPISHGDAAMAPIRFDELVASSDLILIGNVGNIQGYWADDVIRSKVEIIISQVVAGDTQGARTIEVDIIGGVVGNVGLSSSNQPLPESGEEVLLFLRAETIAGVYRVNGLAQGYVGIVDGQIPRFGLAVEALVDRIKQQKQ